MRDAGSASSSATAMATISIPSFDELVARQIRVAPGMREILRGDTSASAALPEAGKDECVRVVYAAGAPVRVTLKGRDGAILATSTVASSGTLDARGPVCFRRDTAPELDVQSDAGPVRFVIWGS
jgi:hypothetical protein